MHGVSRKNVLQIFRIFEYCTYDNIFSFQVSRNKDGSTPLGFASLLRHIPTESFDITTRQGLPGYLLAANIPLQLQLRWFSVLCLLKLHGNGKTRQALLNLERPCAFRSAVLDRFMQRFLYTYVLNVIFDYSEHRIRSLYFIDQKAMLIFFINRSIDCKKKL